MGSGCCQGTGAGAEKCCQPKDECCAEGSCCASEQLPVEIEKRLCALKYFQEEHNKLDQDLRKEIHELEKKFQSLKAPLYQKRFEIVSGQREPLPEESSPLDDENDVQDVSESTASDSSVSGIKGIPTFWLTALINCSGISPMVQPDDLPALKHLIDISCQEIDHGFCLRFTFEENEFFSNTCLEKTFEFEGELVDFAEDSFVRAVGSTVEWKEGKCLTHRKVTKSQRNKKTGATRSVSESVETPSFFSFFSTIEMPNADSAEEVDEEEEAELEQQFYEEFYLGDLFKNKIIPNAFDWFAGIASLPEDEFGNPGEYDDEEEDEDDDEDSEEDSNEDSEEDSDAEPRIKSKAAGARPECKNQ